MLTIKEESKDLFTVRFLDSYESVSIDEIKEELSIQDNFEDDLSTVLDHLMDHKWDTIRLPEELSREVCETYIQHFNTCLDSVLQQSFDQYEQLVIEGFVRDVLPFIIEEMELDGIKDIPARRESFNNYSDSLCKNDIIPERVYNDICLPDRFE